MKRLLIIRFSALGDVAMLVPLVKQLGQAYPDWEVTVLSKAQYEPLFRWMPMNVNFYGVDFKRAYAHMPGLNHLLHDLDYKHFDAVADMHDVLRSKFIRIRTFWEGAKIAHIHKDRFQKWLLIRHSLKHKHPLVSEVARYKAVLAQLGFFLPEIPIADSEQPIPRANIGIAPFAAHRGKIYPINKMKDVVQALGKYMADRGEVVYLFGAGKQEHLILKAWEEKYEGVRVAKEEDMAAELDLMATLRLMLTMDSSNMHLGSIAGTRVLSIWGATHPYTGFMGQGQKPED